MDMLIREIMESRMTPGTSMKEQTIREGPRGGEALFRDSQDCRLGLWRCEGPQERDPSKVEGEVSGFCPHHRWAPTPLPQISMWSSGPREMRGAQERPSPLWGPPYCWSWCGPFPPW